MKEFLASLGSLVTSVLSGFDRLVFRGTLQSLMIPRGLHGFLKAQEVKLVEFPDYAKDITKQIKNLAEQEAKQLGRPYHYLQHSSISKESLAKRILANSPVDSGLVCTLSALETCRTFEYHRSQDQSERGYRLRSSKCLHLYKYFLHPQFGFMNARIQTYFPFNIQICMNGREWLARQLDSQGSRYERADNCFTWLENPKLAQHFLDRQLKTNWPQALDAVVPLLNPLHPFIFSKQHLTYYWTAYQTEWATDIQFSHPRALAEIYPELVRHAMEHFKSPDVMRFLGGKVSGNFKGEIISDFKDRPEGVRVKHWARGNSVKMYDKGGNLLRVETTMGKPAVFTAYRPDRNNPKSRKWKWQRLRKSVADLHRRAKLSQKINESYLQALSATRHSSPCGKIFDAVSRPVIKNGHRTRALRLNDREDIALLQAISRGEFTVEGFRNSDIRHILNPRSSLTCEQRRRLSAKTSRLFRILRDHGVILKVRNSHRYHLTERGQLLTTALFATRTASVQQLLKKAA